MCRGSLLRVGPVPTSDVVDISLPGEAPVRYAASPGLLPFSTSSVAPHHKPSAPLSSSARPLFLAPGRSADPPRQRHALDPGYPALNPNNPHLSKCSLKRVHIADRPGGVPEHHDVVKAAESGLTFMFVRMLKEAIYGEVWSALEVKLHSASDSGSGGVDYYSPVLDEEGVPRRLAVKRMPWRTIHEKIRLRILENPLHEITYLTRMQDPGHPNVVGLAEALHDGTNVYLATPFVGGEGGGELFDWVAENQLSPAPEAVIRPLFHQIVDGMRYIHSKGICHADMSLENTLVNATRTKAFIIDFGMALQMPIDEFGRRFKSLPDGRRAKPSYCAPETFKGREPYDGVKVDIFSVGCMAFMMFTGVPPFQLATRLDPDFRKVVYRGDLQGYLRDKNRPLLPQPVNLLLKRMMAYRPEDRPLPEEVLEHPWFASMAAAAVAAQASAQQQQEEAPPPMPQQAEPPQEQQQQLQTTPQQVQPEVVSVATCVQARTPQQLVSVSLQQGAAPVDTQEAPARAPASENARCSAMDV
ncbi:unnamed protein product [Scytosiphon promiscuus]